MNIKITRYEIVMITGAIEILQIWNFDNWDSAIKLLNKKTHIDFEPMRAELSENETSSFERREMVCNGAGGYLANVGYEIEQSESLGDNVDNEPLCNTFETEYSAGIGSGYKTQL